MKLKSYDETFHESVAISKCCLHHVMTIPLRCHPISCNSSLFLLLVNIFCFLPLFFILNFLYKKIGISVWWQRDLFCIWFYLSNLSWNVNETAYLQHVMMLFLPTKKLIWMWKSHTNTGMAFEFEACFKISILLTHRNISDNVECFLFLYNVNKLLWWYSIFWKE